jgi:hypothetical protein
MTQHEVVMAKLASIDAKLESLLDLVRAGVTAPEEDEDNVSPDHSSISSPPRVPQCVHSVQKLEGRNIVCAKCGHVIVDNTGIGNHIAGSGTRESSR